MRFRLGWKYLWQGRQIQCEHPAKAKTQVTAVALKGVPKSARDNSEKKRLGGGEHPAETITFTQERKKNENYVLLCIVVPCFETTLEIRKGTESSPFSAHPHHSWL